MGIEVSEEKKQTMRPFDIIVDQPLLELLRESGGWMIPIDYKIGDKLTIWIEE